MQQLECASVQHTSATDCAAEILDTIPTVMRFIRVQMRRHRGSDLSVPQFRALAFLSLSPAASLSALADFLGLSLPATSRLIEGLVRKGLVLRRIPAGNRRVVALSVSARGQKSVSAARRATEKQLTKVVGALGEQDRAIVRRALHVLREVFQSVAMLD